MTDEKADEKKDRLNGESSWEMSSVIRSFDYSMGKGLGKGVQGLSKRLFTMVDVMSVIWIANGGDPPEICWKVVFCFCRAGVQDV